MIQTLLDDIKAYFDAKERLTEQEQLLRQRLSGGYFPITSVHRDDLQGAGFDVEKISDDDMKELASKMADDYCEQLFWSSMEIIAGDILGFPKEKVPVCPICKSEYLHTETSGLHHCNQCGQTWNDNIYVLVEFPEDTTSFEDEEIGYPSWDSEDNGARYVPEQDYIRRFKKSPDPGKCYRAVCWPESQQYMGQEGCESIQDENGIQDFGTSAYWVPLLLTDEAADRRIDKKETPVCPECGGTDIDILGDESVAVCNACHLEWSYTED